MMVIERACAKPAGTWPNSAVSSRASATWAGSLLWARRQGRVRARRFRSLGRCPRRGGSTSRRCGASPRSTARSDGPRVTGSRTRSCSSFLRHPRPGRARGSGQRRERPPDPGADDRRGRERPTSLEADAILAERGIPILPDVLTNAGGVTVSFRGCRTGRLFDQRNWAKLAGTARRRFRALERSLRNAGSLAQRGTRRRNPRGRRRTHGRASTRDREGARRDDSRPADGRGEASAQEAGQHLVSPDVRAVYVCEEGASSASSRARRWCERLSRPGEPRRDGDRADCRAGALVDRSGRPARRGLPLDRGARRRARSGARGRTPGRRLSRSVCSGVLPKTRHRTSSTHSSSSARRLRFRHRLEVRPERRRRLAHGYEDHRRPHIPATQSQSNSSSSSSRPCFQSVPIVSYHAATPPT